MSYSCTQPVRSLKLSFTLSGNSTATQQFRNLVHANTSFQETSACKQQVRTVATCNVVLWLDKMSVRHITVNLGKTDSTPAPANYC